MKAYVINLSRAARRWRFCTAALEAAGIPYVRVDAVDGQTLEFPHPDFDEAGYHRRQGRKRIPAEVGCFFSHLKALRVFVDSGEAHGLIMEDDATAPPDLKPILDAALLHAGQWDLLRLSRINKGRALRLMRLDTRHHLGLMFTREKGAGAYVVNRHAATRMLAAFVPMNLPFDIMFDREWLFGYRTLVVYPFPVSQKGYPTQIQYDIRDQYLPHWRRYWTVFPYRTAWEIGRIISRAARVPGLIAYRIFRSHRT